MTTVLVTGASGFIGRFLISYLLAQKVKVYALVRNKMSDFPKEVMQRIGDLTNIPSLQGVTEDIDVVFHLAGYAHAEDNPQSDALHMEINLMGVQNILNECLRSKVKKFIFFSTIKAVKENEACINEEWIDLPQSAYGKAKRRAEELVLNVGQRTGMFVSILRLALVYGPGIKGNLYQMLRAVDKKYFFGFPPVKNRRSLISVYDVCRAAWLVSRSPTANGRIYFLTETRWYSTYQIYSEMRKALGMKLPRWFIPLIFFKTFAYIGDTIERLTTKSLPFNSTVFQKLFGSAECSAMRIQNELGFSAKYELSTLLPDIIHFYRNTQKL